MSDSADRSPASDRRVVLVLEEGGAPDSLFELGARLARTRAGSLVAQVRENLDLLTAAALPFVQQVDRCSATVHEWTVEQAREDRARAARQWERRLAHLGREYALQTRLEWVRGSWQERLLDGLASSDVLVIGSGRSARSAGPMRIAVICQDGGGDSEVLAAAEALGTALSAGVHRLMSDTAPLPGRRAASSVLEPTGGQEGLPGALGAAARIRAQVLVVSREICAAVAPEVLRTFLARPGRSLVVLP